MSSTKYAAALALEPRVSRHLRRYLLALHGMAAALLFFIPWPVQYSFACAALIGISLYRAWITHITRCGRHSVMRLIAYADGGWVLTLANGEEHPARLLADSYIHPWIIILRFAIDKRRLAVILPNDALPADTLRELRVRLRIASPVVTDDGLP